MARFDWPDLLTRTCWKVPALIASAKADLQPPRKRAFWWLFGGQVGKWSSLPEEGRKSKQQARFCTTLSPFEKWWPVIAITALACAEVHNLDDEALSIFPPNSSFQVSTPSPTSTTFTSPYTSISIPNTPSHTKHTIFKMPPKAAEKKPTASKAPAKAPVAEKKEAGKKTAATGEKKKRTKTRKETYSSYIYKGTIPLIAAFVAGRVIWEFLDRVFHPEHHLSWISISTASQVASLSAAYLLTCHSLVLKQVHPDTGISNRAMSILNSFVNGMHLPHRLSAPSFF